MKEPTHHKLSTAGIAVKATPVGFNAFAAWAWSWRKGKKARTNAETGEKPATSQLSYLEGLRIVRKFLNIAAQHPLDELQAFTAHRVPSPSWVAIEVETIGEAQLDKAAHLISKHFSRDPRMVELVGGHKWWQSRGRPLTAEWIEMKKQKIKRGGMPSDRVCLYVHGGAHFFSSLETHRYQIQRWARKLGARAFAPSYRLSPQYPFPASLQDVLATYLHLLDSGFKPSQILFAGDSSGAGLCLALMCLLRDLELPLPAGGLLVSPWVDLSHSFDSISADDSGDYIPSRGFHYRPGPAWPPLPLEQTEPVALVGDKDGSTVLLVEQMQMYAPNSLLSAPMVSPVNQASLGGLPPLWISAGSAELLRDEIIYVAHKAAAPADRFPPSPATLDAFPSQQKALDAKYPPTLVQLSVFDEACHVVTTLSITKPARYMYRSGANFGLWAYTAAAKADYRHNHDVDVPSTSHHRHHLSERHSRRSQTSSIDNSPSSSGFNTPRKLTAVTSDEALAANAEAHSISDESDLSSDSGSSGSDNDANNDDDDGFEREDPRSVLKVTGHIPPFENHMIRQRISTSGQIRDMEPVESLAACNMNPAHVGQLHSGPVRRWLETRAEWDKKYDKDLTYWRQIRQADYELARNSGYLQGKFQGERPPSSSLVHWHDEKMALRCGQSVDEIAKETSAALEMWAKLSAEADEAVVGADKVQEAKEQVKSGFKGEEKQSAETAAA